MCEVLLRPQAFKGHDLTPGNSSPIIQDDIESRNLVLIHFTKMSGSLPGGQFRPGLRSRLRLVPFAAQPVDEQFEFARIEQAAIGRRRRFGERGHAIEDDDSEMAAAIARARSTLPHLWQVFDKRERGDSKFSLKVEVKDKRSSEFFWGTDLQRRDGKTMGTINNDPNLVASVKLGDRIEIPEADIADWLYMRDAKMIGNETLKPLLKTMPAEEAARFKSIMADP